MNYFENKTIVVTGGKGFLGSFVTQKLQEKNPKSICSLCSKDYNLININEVRAMYNNTKPNIVIHLAAKVGGIGINKEKPAEFFYDNLMMGVNVLHEAFMNKIEKVIIIGTICSYPKLTSIPFKEENLWNGYPEDTNAPYGLAKKSLLVMSQAYRQQYGFNSINILPVNLYGPKDNFNPNSSHVIPAIIKKIYEAQLNGEEEVVLWGDGLSTREFLYVEDAAEAIVKATELYNEKEPINIGSGKEILIEDLVAEIIDIMEYTGKIIWDESKPNGQPRRCLDTSKAKEKFDFTAKMSLREGLIKTIEWYKKSISN